MTTDPTPDRPSQLRVGSLDYTPGALDTSHLRPEVAEHHQAVAAELIDHAARCVLDILAVTMHHADFTYNVTAELVNNLVTFATTRTPDLCCEHGAAVDQLAVELKRANQLLADLVEIRRAQAGEKTDPERIDLDEVVRFARGGIAKGPRAMYRPSSRAAATTSSLLTRSTTGRSTRSPTTRSRSSKGSP